MAYKSKKLRNTKMIQVNLGYNHMAPYMMEGRSKCVVTDICWEAGSCSDAEKGPPAQGSSERLEKTRRLPGGRQTLTGTQ
jgi:hypothetical protein